MNWRIPRTSTFGNTSLRLMPARRLSENQLEEIGAWVADYIAEQRKRFRDRASPLCDAHQKQMAPFFPPDVMSSTRVIRGRATDPPFYEKLSALGITNVPSFADMAGVTFQDVILHVERLTPRLLFHELVHAVQYKHLGLRGFAVSYVSGFLRGGSYEEIPLEKQAYELEDRFSLKPEETFSVESDVESRIRMKRF